MRRTLTAIVLVVAMGGAVGGAEESFATSSKIESLGHLPEYAVDGDGRTRWSSGYAAGRKQWLVIDLGERVRIDRLVIHWERAFAVEYHVEVSNDAKRWTRVFETKEGKGGRVELAKLGGAGRYVRIMCFKPERYNNFSIWELDFPDADAAAALKRARARAVEARRKAGIERKRLLAEMADRHGFREIVFAVRENAPDGHWYANFGYFCDGPQRTCYRAQGRLCKLDVRTSTLTVLVDDPKGGVRDPVVHYDGRKILFSWRRGGEAQYHLWEINIDGTGLQQLTDGIYDDIEPTYLPDGGIIFVSSRCKRWVNCWLTQVGVLYRCDGKGKSIRQISANIEHDNTPWVLPDGRILYQRWEYVDRSQVNYHHLWATNPDGAGQTVYFGNMFPGSVYIDAKPIPGTNQVVLVNSPGHGRREHAGRLAILDPGKGVDHRQSLRNVTGEDFRDPYPLSAQEILAARWNSIVLVDPAGKVMELFRLPKEYGRLELHEPRPIIEREREPIIPPRVDLAKSTGTLMLADVYAGRNMRGVKHGEIKKLLVLETLPKPINYTGGMEPLTYGGSFTLERIVGAVPVEADGSAHFELPANRALFFVALDAHDRSVKRMQSFLTVMPGETTGCVGCHESRTQAPPARFAGLEAMRRPASHAEPVDGVPDVFDFPRDIQPILDARCVGCHDPDKREGGVLLAGDRGPMYSHSFYTLSARRQIADGRNRARSNYAPRQIGDSASPLVAKLVGGHHDVKATAGEVRLVRYWINSGAPYIGTYAGLGTGSVGDYRQNQMYREDVKWPSRQAAVQVIATRCAGCHTGDRRLPDSPSDHLGMTPQSIRYGDPRERLSRHIVYNLTRPEKSALILAPLARAAGGWGMQKRDAKGKPTGDCVEVFQDRNDPGYRALLAAIQDAKKKLDEIKRFDMPGFRPHAAYVREMKRYGVLPRSFDPATDSVDVYALDRKYWRSLWYRPVAR